MLLAAIVTALAALSGDQVLVDPKALDSLDRVLVLDARAQADVEKGHVPGAAHVDVESLSETRDGVRGLLKPVEAVRALVAEAGVDPRKHIVVYSAAGDVKRATRLFWILEYLGYPEVSVLDGGYEQWQTLGKAPATGALSVPSVPVESLPAEVRPELLASRDEVKGGACSLVDLRAAEEYSGEAKKDFVAKSGHIPGATSLPAGDLVQEDTLRFQPKGAIADLLKQQNAGDDKRVVTYCNTGRDASVGYFAYRLMGHDDVALYDGSMAEWAQGEDVVKE